jgi:ATP-dependent phosphoenolpyruvate carboxykinase
VTALFDFKDHDVTVAEIHRNLPPSALYEHTIRHEKNASIAENGALIAYARVKTGRSVKDKRVCKASRLRSSPCCSKLRKRAVTADFAHVVSNGTVLGRFHVNKRIAALL